MGARCYPRTMLSIAVLLAAFATGLAARATLAVDCRLGQDVASLDVTPMGPLGVSFPEAAATARQAGNNGWARADRHVRSETLKLPMYQPSTAAKRRRHLSGTADAQAVGAVAPGQPQSPRTPKPASGKQARPGEPGRSSTQVWVPGIMKLDVDENGDTSLRVGPLGGILKLQTSGSGNPKGAPTSTAPSLLDQDAASPLQSLQSRTVIAAQAGTAPAAASSYPPASTANGYVRTWEPAIAPAIASGATGGQNRDSSADVGLGPLMMQQARGGGDGHANTAPQLRLSIGPGGILYRQQGDAAPGGDKQLQALGGTIKVATKSSSTSSDVGGVVQPAALDADVSVGLGGAVYKQVQDGGSTKVGVLAGPAAALI